MNFEEAFRDELTKIASLRSEGLKDPEARGTLIKEMHKQKRRGLKLREPGAHSGAVPPPETTPRGVVERARSSLKALGPEKYTASLKG